MMKNVLRLTLALAALIAVIGVAQGLDLDAQPDAEIRDALDRPVDTAPPGLINSGMGLGLLLLGAWFAGRLFKAISLPKISGFLLFGVLVGPSVLALVTKDSLDYLRLINDLAIAMIALTAGGQIHLDFVKRTLRIIAGVAGLQMVGILLVVAGTTYFLLDAVGVTSDLDVPQRIALATIVATVATAGAPAVILAVVSELSAGGLTPRLALSVTVVKDLFLIGAFAVVMAISTPMLIDAATSSSAPDDAQTTRQTEQANGSPDEGASNGEEAEGDPLEGEELPDAPSVQAAAAPSLVGGLTWLLGGSVLAGVFLGLGLAWYMHAVNAALPAFVIMTCFGIAFFSEALGLQPLIVALVAGLLMVNVWKESSAGLFETVDEVSLPVYCVFFAVAGAKIDLLALADVWQAALAIVLVRGVVVWVTTWIGVRADECTPAIRRWLWTAFIPQAGVSVLLAAIVQRTFEGQGFADVVYSIMLAAIALQEVVGPILLKIGLVRIEAAGEAEEPPSEAAEESVPRNRPSEPAPDQPAGDAGSLPEAPDAPPPPTSRD